MMQVNKNSLDEHRQTEKRERGRGVCVWNVGCPGCYNSQAVFLSPDGSLQKDEEPPPGHDRRDEATRSKMINGPPVRRNPVLGLPEA